MIFLVFFLIVFFSLTLFFYGKRYSTDGKLKFRVWLSLLPLTILFVCIDLWNENSSITDFIFAAVVSVFIWLIFLIPIYYKWRGYYMFPFDSDYETDSEERNMDDHFDLALKIAKKKKEGEDSSEDEFVYERERQFLDATDYDTYDKDGDLFEYHVNKMKEQRKGEK